MGNIDLEGPETLVVTPETGEEEEEVNNIEAEKSLTTEAMKNKRSLRRSMRRMRKWMRHNRLHVLQ